MKRTTQNREAGSQAAVGSHAHWWRTSIFWPAALGSLLLFAALPPLSLGFLGWIAPIPWLLIIRREVLPGRRPYVALWLAGVLFWFLSLHWLRLPHPATSAGWIAVALYLGLYPPALIGVGRGAVHALGVPLWLAAPIAWTGLELVRAHLLTGFLMASLAHSQIQWPEVLQIADLGGEYAVDFVMVLVAACLAEVWGGCWRRLRERDAKSEAAPRGAWRYELLTPFLIAGVATGATLGYGNWRLQQEVHEPGPLVALIQGDIRPEWKADPSRSQRIMKEYTRVSKEAVRNSRQKREGRPPDLVVWPETMFRAPIFEFEPGHQAPAEVDAGAYRRSGPERIADLVEILKSPVLVGVDVVRFLASPSTGGREFASWNAAVLAKEDGTIVGRYAKIHLVVFGEYIPFAEYLPWLYGLTPLTGGVTAGEGPVALASRGIVYAPNICYESVLPHVIRQQVAELTEAGTPPDVLVNLTNDAWYWGSSELDMHLACDVMRAVENRTPHLVAANGGISAHIDSCGRVVEQSPRQQADFILADVHLDPRRSFYSRIGDWFAGACLVLSGAFAFLGWMRRRGTTGRRPQAAVGGGNASEAPE